MDVEKKKRKNPSLPRRFSVFSSRVQLANVSLRSRPCPRSEDDVYCGNVSASTSKFEARERKKPTAGRKKRRRCSRLEGNDDGDENEKKAKPFSLSRVSFQPFISSILSRGAREKSFIASMLRIEATRPRTEQN